MVGRPRQRFLGIMLASPEATVEFLLDLRQADHSRCGAVPHQDGSKDMVV